MKRTSTTATPPCRPWPSARRRSTSSARRTCPTGRCRSSSTSRAMPDEELRLPDRRPRRRGRRRERCTPSGRTRRTRRCRHLRRLPGLLEGRTRTSPLFHYGSYEKTFLKRMRKVVKRKRLVDRVLAKAVNVLSVIHAHVYFPTFSNGLKDVGRYLGCSWTRAENASGLQSLVWRARWEHGQARTLEGEAADLQRGGLCRPEEGDGVRPGHRRAARSPARRGGSRPVGHHAVAWADEVSDRWTTPAGVGRATFALPDFDHDQPLCLLRLPEGEGLPPHQQGRPQEASREAA